MTKQKLLAIYDALPKDRFYIVVVVAGACSSAVCDFVNDDSCFQ